MEDKNNLILRINHITKNINKNSNTKNILSLMKKRFVLMNKVLPLVNDDENVFIMPFVTPHYYISKSIIIIVYSTRSTDTNVELKEVIVWMRVS